MESRILLVDALETLVELNTISTEISDKLLYLADQMVEEEKLRKDAEVKVIESSDWYQTITDSFIPFSEDFSEMYIYAFD